MGKHKTIVVKGWQLFETRTSITHEFHSKLWGKKKTVQLKTFSTCTDKPDLVVEHAWYIQDTILSAWPDNARLPGPCACTSHKRCWSKDRSTQECCHMEAHRSCNITVAAVAWICTAALPIERVRFAELSVPCLSMASAATDSKWGGTRSARSISRLWLCYVSTPSLPKYKKI